MSFHRVTFIKIKATAHIQIVRPGIKTTMQPVRWVESQSSRLRLTMLPRPAFEGLSDPALAVGQHIRNGFSDRFWY
jgi:hypothetical protein